MDVNFLAQHASDSCFVFLVDSAARDAAAWPTAAQYEVSFNAPFENVVGVDLLDASVPRTEYLVDTHENELVLDVAGQRRRVRVPAGDYNLAQLVEALDAAMPAGLSVRCATTPAEIMNKVVFDSDAPFAVDAAASSMRKPLGLGRGLRGPLVAEPGELPDALTALDAPLPSPGTQVPLAVPVRQRFVAPADAVPSLVTLFARADAPGTDLVVQVRRAADDAVVAVGTPRAGTVGFQQLDAPLSATGRLDAGAEYYVFVSGPPGAAVYATGPSVEAFVASAWTAGADALCVGVQARRLGWTLAAPDLVDLTGERYLCVRCPEIESFLYRDRAYERVHAGLGMVKLGGYGVQRERFDFVQVPPRRLRNPVGKLTKLTIRLEKADGSLYDTRGLDHCLLMAVRYREFTAQPDVGPKPPLQPAYAPDPTKRW